jgi:ankyrin repeat protein
MSIAYQHVREKLIVGSTSDQLLDFELPAGNNQGLSSEEYYFKQLIQSEEMIMAMKYGLKDGSEVAQVSVLRPLVYFSEELDKGKLCELIFVKPPDIQTDLSTTKLANTQILALIAASYQKEFNEIMSACIFSGNGDITKLITLYSNGVDLNKTRDYDLRTPLHYAAKQGRLEIAKFLLVTALVDVNPRDRWGSTPLTYVADPSSDTYKYLVSRGAKLGTPNPIKMSRYNLV